MDENVKDEKHPLVVYHGMCNDGFCSAWIARLAMPNADFLPARHNTAPPNVKGRDVFMLDFAYHRPEMEEMKKAARSLLVLDHHITAKQELEGLNYCKFDLSHAGSNITWNFFRNRIRFRHQIEDKPWIIDYVEDRDLLKWQLPYSREINASIDAYPMNFTAWDDLWSQPKDEAIDRFVAEGKPIVRFQERLVDRIVCDSKEVKLLDWKVRAVNTAALMPEAATKISQGYPFGVAWFQREDGQYVYSLRTTCGFDLSKIAKTFGGGGHANAAGFETRELIF